MATLTMNDSMRTKDLVPERKASETSAVTTAYYCLYAAFVLVPLIMGVDKFFHVLTNWDQFAAPVVLRFTGLDASSLMKLSGIIEIVAAIGVFAKPRWFGIIVSAWLVVIVLNLLLLGGFYDVIVRDLSLALGAFALSKLAIAHESLHNLAARGAQKEIAMY